MSRIESRPYSGPEGTTNGVPLGSLATSSGVLNRGGRCRRASGRSGVRGGGRGEAWLDLLHKSPGPGSHKAAQPVGSACHPCRSSAGKSFRVD